MHLPRIALLVSIVSFWLVKPNSLRADEPASAALQKAGWQAYRALRKRDWDQFISMLSGDDSFYIALRRAVWTEHESKPPKDLPLHMLDDVSPYGWEERQMEFDTKHPDLIPKLKTALGRIAREMDNTYGTVETAMHPMDEWKVRPLGPSASGKMASNYFWYIYFREEGGKWKIWKLELAEH